jgi:hypothetical protein
MTIGVDFSGDLPDGKAVGLGFFFDRIFCFAKKKKMVKKFKNK